MKEPWTDAERAYLRAHAEDQTASEMAHALGRTQSAVFTQCCRLGLVRQRPWTAEDEDKLRAALGRLGLQDTALLLGRTATATRQRAQKLGLPVSSGRPYERRGA